MTPWTTKLVSFLLGMVLAGLLVFLLLQQSRQVTPVANAAKSNNLAYVDCRKHLGATGTTKIVVDSARGIKRDDEAIFVCTGETVHWETSDKQIKDFTVDFSKGNGWPFGTAAPVPLKGDPSTPTTDQVVAGLSSGQRSAAFSYKVVINLTNGSTMTVDPVIIPMGD